MKNTPYLFYLIFVLLSFTSSAQTISSSIQVNNPTFLQGLTGIYDTISVGDLPSGTNSTNFIVLNSDGDSIAVLSAIDDTTAVQDMGLVDTSATTIRAVFYDVDGTNLGTSDDYSFSVKPLPDWANKPDSADNGTIALESFESTGLAQIVCTLPLYQKLITIPGDVWGIGGKQFGINQNSITFKGTYDLDNGGAGTINAGDKTFNFQLSAFELSYPNPPYSFNLDSLANATVNMDFDNDLNLTLDARYSNTMNLIRFKSHEWKAHLPPPLSAIGIGVSVGFNLDGGFSAKALMGQDGNEFGFVGDIGTDSASSVTIGGKVTGTVWGNINLISKKLAGLEGEVSLLGSLGAQYRFRTIPEFADTLVWGGDLQLTGKLRLTGWGGWLGCKLISGLGGNCGDGGEILDGPIWPFDGNPYPINGGLPSGLSFGGLIAHSQNNYARSLTYQNNYMDDALKNLSQPDFSTKGERIGVVWIEEDSISQHLAFSEKNPSQNAFRPALLVNDTLYSLNHPKVALAGNGDAVIVWAQNKLTPDDISPNTTVNDLINAQDIWIAIYDSSADDIVYRSKIYEEDEDLSDGMPTVTLSDSGKAIITWLSEDTSTGHTDIWETELTKDNGIWYQSDPVQLTNDDGNNFNVQVAFTDSSHAIATWINDADGDDSIPGNNIMYAYYDGSIWSDPVAISNSDDGISYRELAMGLNNGYAALAYTYTDYSDSINTQNRFSIEVYDIINQTWLTNSQYDYEDSLSDVRLPRISISEDGIAAASFQTVPLETDTNGDANMGSINLVAQNLATNSGWQFISNNQLISDSTVQTWDMDLAFGANNTLYTLSHESDTVSGNDYHPKTGILFGNPGTSLVLRGLKFSNDLQIDSLAQDSLPDTPTGVTAIAAENKEALRLNVYPNPSSNYAVVEFYLPQPAITKLEIFNLLGESIATPVNQYLGQGSYKTVFEPNNLPNGVYILRLFSGNESKSLKLILN